MKDVVGGEINGFNDDTKIKEFVDDTDALVETFLKDKKQRYLKKGDYIKWYIYRKNVAYF